jgi:hypothetical protein
VKLVLSCPTYGPTDPQADRSRRVAIMHAARHAGIEWVGDASPDRQPFSAARNNTVESVVNEDVDGIFWMDSDVIFPQDAVSRLVSHGKDFVTGIYFQRSPPHWPLIAHYNENARGRNGRKGSFNWWAKWPENVLAPIDGCGFGCVYTSIEMFRKMGPPWFEYLHFSEDFDLCLKAAKAGFQLYVDTAVLCGHLMDPRAAGFDEFRRQRPDLYGGEHGLQGEAGNLVVSKAG